MPVISRLALLVLAAASVQAQSVLEGIELFEQGRYTAAEAALEGLPDKRARAFVALARAATGRCGQAAGGLQAAFDEKSDRQVKRLAGLALARCRIAEKSFAGALSLLNLLASEFPDDGDVLYETARLHLKAWNDAVERMFDKAPASFRVNQLSAEIFEIRGRFSEAVAEYRRAVEKNPQAINLHYRLGRALLMESHAPEALAAARREFEAELRLNPNDAVAEYQIARILEVEGEHEAARERLEKRRAAGPRLFRGADCVGPRAVRAKELAARGRIARTGRRVGAAKRIRALQPDARLPQRGAASPRRSRSKSVSTRCNAPPRANSPIFCGG